jgi:hypothetical protein
MDYRAIVQNVSVSLAATALTLLLCDVALRMPALAPPPLLPAALGGGAAYDPNLGWRLVSNISSDSFNTLEHGIRKNQKTDEEIRTGGALAVGDSFTAGSEVHDEASWPAQLERLTGMPVINAGAGGYGTDQIIMRAEQLLQIVKPRVLVIGMLEGDIERSGYSSQGAAKPYYTTENDQLVLHNVPVPQTPPVKRNWLHSLAPYSALAARITRLTDARDENYVRAKNDPVKVTCLLLQRIKRIADRAGIRTLLAMQHGAYILRDQDTPLDRAIQVETCATAMGIQVVDEFNSLKAILRADPSQLAAHYVMTNGAPGHMSEQGNAHMAGLLAAALSGPPLIGSADGYVPAVLIAADGPNLLPDIDRLVIGAAYATFTADGGGAFRLAANGPSGGHYVVTTTVPAKPGLYVLSMEVRAGSTACLTLQLRDENQRGVMADYDLRTGIASLTGETAPSAHADVTEAGGGWHRAWISAELSGTDLRAILQLGDAKCSTHFNPSGESLLLRDIRLERGQVPSRLKGSVARQ